jgi:putative Ca2+/H+ antiporter (TMEM165/GDT1 family)
MNAFLVSTVTVAGAEIGDKTQFLAIILASRYKKPIPIILGIFVAALLSNLLAGIIGQWLGSQVKSSALHIVLACAYLIAAIWILIPEKQETEHIPSLSHGGIFLTTLVTFFVAEMGDKTQVVTAVLAANYQALTSVVLGASLGLLLANIPAVFLGNKASQFIPIKLMRIIAASIFIALAVFELKIYW